MKFTINSQIFEKFPNLNIGVVVVKNMNNMGTSEDIQKQLKTIENEVRAKHNPETLSQNPKIEVWRKSYSSFGAKPKENKSSVESLYRMVLKGISLRHINKVVDIYNLISLKYMVPLGGEDIDKIKGDITLTFAGSNEALVLLLGDKDARPPHSGEVIYKDGISAICRRWNWREAERTKLTEETKNCILVMEGLLPVTKKDIENAANGLKDIVQKFCGGSISVHILEKNKPEIEF
ncbi:hypothetical protein COV19_00650 [Candidatus Woesearchaeota archaeon CG10_big_fil_rev_8_21_14_0_10_44_13]|nr:MAG: hypothetical protein COV19_00650 [Candidatus Woesearchaeota archaeon CG10_big_fil_rev_8_21_14_0_10_44_13]